MELTNHTPFPSLAIAGLDQHGRDYHVVLLRQTLNFSTGSLEYADVQAPLVEADVFFGEANKSSVRYESDYCLFKPKCDVIVNATAYAPGGCAVTQFATRVIVSRPGSSNADTLIDKSLCIRGERQFMKRPWPIRAAISALKFASLSTLHIPNWKLTQAAALTSLPLRYEYAFGGHFENEKEPSLNTTFDANPIGCGFARSTNITALRCKSMPAPRIERPGYAIDSSAFCRWQNNELPPKYARALYDAINTPAGYGVRHKTHPARVPLLGTVDEAFIQSDAPLPPDFDFAYFDAAPVDQQTDHLANDEVIELYNLSPLATPGLETDSQGDNIMRLHLLKHECFALLRMHGGAMSIEPLLLDTVIIEPNTWTASLVWRLAMPKDADFPVRLCEVRMRTHAERDYVNAIRHALEGLNKGVGQRSEVMTP